MLKAAASYFALVFGAGFVLGSTRVPFLVPRVGARTAKLLQTPLMLVEVIFDLCGSLHCPALHPAADTIAGMIYRPTGRNCHSCFKNSNHNP